MDQNQANRSSRKARNLWMFGAGFVVLALAAGALVAWLMLRPAAIVTLTVAAGPLGSDSYTLLSQVSEVAERHGKPVRLKVLSTPDPSSNIVALNSGDVQLAAIRADTAVVSDVRLVADLFADSFQLIVRADAGIHDVADLVDKRIAVPPAGTDAYLSFFVVAGHYDVPVDRMRWQPMELQKAGNDLLAGKVDAMFVVRSLRDPELLRLFDDAALKHLRLDLVELDQAEAIALRHPLMGAGTIPLGALSGAMPSPSRSIATVTVDRLLVARADADPAAIRALTEVLFENRLDLVLRMPLAADVRQPDETAGLSIPLHAGALSYYDRNQPSFLQQNAEPLALGLTVIAMLGSGLLALRARLMAGQKNRADVYNYRLLELNGRALMAPDPAALVSIRHELADMLETVVVALDTDDVTDDGFAAFIRIHESVAATVRDREAAMRNASGVTLA